MEWVGYVIFALILIFVFRDPLLKILAWIIGPKEWFGGFLLRGSFRARSYTVLIVLLAILLICALVVVLFAASLTGSEVWGWASIALLFLIPLGSKKLWAYLRREGTGRGPSKAGSASPAIQKLSGFTRHAAGFFSLSQTVSSYESDSTPHP